MDVKKNNFMGDIYTSYGPFVGKICENTNTQLHHDNIIESVTSSITANSINMSNHTSPMENVIGGRHIDNVQYTLPLPVPNPIPSNTNTNANTNIIPIPIPHPTVKSSHRTKGSKKIKFGGEVSKHVVTEQVSINDSNLVDEESGNFFNYKISIYHHKISIWILLLTLLVIICIGYFIYKYWYLKNTTIITYEKTNKDKITNREKSNGENSNGENSNGENSSVNPDGESDNSTSTSSSSS